MRFPLDLHLHTHETCDARDSTVEAMCRRASETGVREIAFTNHVILGNPDYTISPEAFRQHVADIDSARARFPALTIRLGLEVDYFPGREGQLRALLEHYQALAERPLDLVLGSIHHVRGVFFTSDEGRQRFYACFGPEDAYPAYFDLLRRAIDSGLFHAIAHPDAIKRGAPGVGQPWPWHAYREQAELALDRLVATGVALEINTRGLQHPCAEMYPSEPLLAAYVRKCHAAGREPLVTIGCDAHRPGELGFALAEGFALARRQGIGSLCTFDRGRAVLVAMGP